MVARSRRPSFKGCCAMCASGKGKVRGQGDAWRLRTRDLRDFGRSTRINRHDIPDTDLEDGFAAWADESLKWARLCEGTLGDAIWSDD